MYRALGPDLARNVIWSAADPTLSDSQVGQVFKDSDNMHKWAHYLPIYETTLEPFRSRPIKMLEIGVFKGGSLQMWRKYLHPDSVIVGIDIKADCARFDDPDNGIHVRIGGQQDVPFLQRVNEEFGPFDVILDDGSHMSSHMIDTFRYLFPNALADQGAYMVEDIHTNYWFPYRNTPTTFAQFTRHLTDAMHAHYMKPVGERYFRVDGKYRRQNFKVPLATTLVQRIEIYDSVTVVHREQRIPPQAILKSGSDN